MFGVTDSRAALDERDTDLLWTFADHRANDRQRRNVVVDRAVARLYAAQAQAEALELNRAGRFDEAVARLDASRRRIQEYAGSDDVIRAIVDEMMQRHTVYAEPMSALRSKGEHFASLNLTTLSEAPREGEKR